MNKEYKINYNPPLQFCNKRDIRNNMSNVKSIFKKDSCLINIDLCSQLKVSEGKRDEQRV